VRQINIQKL